MALMFEALRSYAMSVGIKRLIVREVWNGEYSGFVISVPQRHMSAVELYLNSIKRPLKKPIVITPLTFWQCRFSPYQYWSFSR